MTKQDIALIERVIRQGSWDEDDPEEARFAQFRSWFGVDPDQFLALLEHIPNRLPCGPLRDPLANIPFHACAVAGCKVRLGPGIGDYCSVHQR